jgi:hypothetical protein
VEANAQRGTERRGILRAPAIGANRSVQTLPVRTDADRVSARVECRGGIALGGAVARAYRHEVIAVHCVILEQRAHVRRDGLGEGHMIFDRYVLDLVDAAINRGNKGIAVQVRRWFWPYAGILVAVGSREGAAGRPRAAYFSRIRRKLFGSIGFVK